MQTRVFNLRLWFAICALCTIAAISAFSAFWVSDFLTTSLLEREAEVSQEFMESILTVDGQAMFAGESAAATPERDRALAYYANHIRSMPGILRVNIYAGDRRMLWSSETQLIGRVFEDNDELAEAARGRRIVEISQGEPDGKSEHVALAGGGHFIEAYVPIHDANDPGRVLGIVEIYKRPESLDATISSAKSIVWTGAASSGLILYLALYWIVQRGARVIEEQQEDIGRMEAFAAIGQMSSAVAHSLRNPMASIRSSAELLRATLSAEDRELASDIINDVDRMDGYVRDLLTYARSEAYPLQPVDVIGVVRRLLTKSRPAIDRSRITVEALGPPKGCKVLADEMLLEQALTSVVTNAIEAMPQGGRLGLSVDDRKGAHTLIRITDTGLGIPHEVMDRVARSYFTTKVRGLGLGLVLARGIIERFDGSLRIASEPGAGTTVSIELRSA